MSADLLELPRPKDTRIIKVEGTLRGTAEHPERLKITADEWIYRRQDGQVIASSASTPLLAYVVGLLPGEFVARHHNAYVNTGLNNALDREFGLGGTAAGFIGVSSNTTAVTASTVFLNGGSGGAAANTIIKAISPVSVRTAQTVVFGATFVNADFTSGVFIWNKIGGLTTSTDAGTGLMDVIGGTGGTTPYNRTFAVDFTNAGAFTVAGQIAVTATAT